MVLINNTTFIYFEPVHLYHYIITYVLFHKANVLRVFYGAEPT